MAPWSGTRSGWNERGNTVREQMNHLASQQIERANPESPYWKSLAQATCDALKHLLGIDDYALWAEITWPGAAIDELTWQQVHETARVALESKEYLWQTLECSCNGVQPPCQVCQAMARIAAQSLDDLED